MKWKRDGLNSWIFAHLLRADAKLEEAIGEVEDEERHRVPDELGRGDPDQPRTGLEYR